MNAAALLTGQGWLGPGHALDARLTDYGAPKYKQKGKRGLAFDGTSITEQSIAGNGLVKPLLVSQRSGRHGIGKKAHEPQAGNQWWMKGFQTALDNIGKSESERTSAANSGISTPNSGYSGKHGGLYGYFIAGQMMRGTLEEWSAAQEEQRQGKKRKSDVLEEDPLAVKPVKKVQTAKDLESSVAYLTQRDKSRRVKHERAQSTDIEQFATVGQFLGATSDGTSKQKHKENNTDIAVSAIEQPDREESKEERRTRRKRRKEAKHKLTLAEMVEEELARLSSVNNSEADSAAGTSESLERTKRKATKTSKQER